MTMNQKRKSRKQGKHTRMDWHRDPVRKEARRRRIRNILLLVLLSGLVAASIPALRAYRSWKQGRLAEDARRALDDGRARDARKLALQQIRSGRDDPNMWDILQEAMTLQNDPAAVDLLQRKILEKGASSEERYEAFLEICRSLPAPGVVRCWFALDVAERSRIEVLEAFIGRLIDQGMLQDAQAILDRSSELAGEDRYRLLEARILLAGPAGADRLSEAQMILASLIRSGGDVSLQAFRALADVPFDSFMPAYFPPLKAWIGQRPDALASDILLASLQELRRFPESRDAHVDELLTRFAEKAPVDCVRWLLHIGRAKQALEIDLDAAGPDAMVIKAELLAAVGLWEELFAWSHALPETAGDDAGLLAHRIVSAVRTGRASFAEHAWSQLACRAESLVDGNAYLDALVVFRTSGHSAEAERALFEAILLGRGKLPFWKEVQPLVSSLRGADRTEDLRRLADAMARIDFTTPEPRLLGIDFQILLERCTPDEALSSLAELEQAAPAVLDLALFHDIRATAHFRKGDYEAALAAIRDLRQDVSPASPRRRALEIASRERIEHPDGSPTTVRKRIPWSSLLPEEAALIKQALEPPAAVH